MLHETKKERKKNTKVERKIGALLALCYYSTATLSTRVTGENVPNAKHRRTEELKEAADLLNSSPPPRKRQGIAKR